MSGINERDNNTMSAESALNTTFTLDIETDVPTKKDVPDFLLDETIAMDSNKTANMKTIIHEDINLKKQFKEQITSPTMQMESSDNTFQILEDRNEELEATFCHNHQLNQTIELAKIPNLYFNEDELNIICQMVREKQFSKFENLQPYSPSQQLAAAFQNLKINVTADETFLSCSDQLEACLVTDISLSNEENIVNDKFLLDNNESDDKCENDVFFNNDNITPGKLEKQKCNSYENFEIKDNEPFDNNIQKPLYVMESHVSESPKNDIIAEITAQFDIEQNHCENVTFENIEAKKQTDLKDPINKSSNVENISNVASEADNTLNIIEENKSHNLTNVVDDQVNNSKIEEDNIISPNISKNCLMVENFMQDINKLVYNNIEEHFEKRNEQTVEVEKYVDDSKPVISDMITPCKSANNNCYEIKNLIPKSRKSTGLTITAMKMEFTPSPLRLIHNNVQSKLTNASPSLFIENSSDYKKYISHKLDINRMQQTIAQLKMEIKEKEAEIIKLFPNKINYAYENLKVNDEKENTPHLGPKEDDVNKKQISADEIEKLNNKIINLENELKLTKETQSHLLEEEEKNLVEIEFLRNDNIKLKQCLCDTDKIISKISSDLNEYKNGIDNEKTKYNELSIKYERVKQILYCMKSNEIIYKKQLQSLGK